jgi:1-acylglycerone phosphate reductase
VYATARRVEAMSGLQHSSIEKMALDVTDDGNVQRVVRRIAEVEGRIDILVNNAGMLGVVLCSCSIHMRTAIL